MCLLFWREGTLLLFCFLLWVFWGFVVFFFSTEKERKPGLHLIILWPQVAYTSPCLLTTECYQNRLAESCLLHVDGHCKSSCRVVFHVKAVSSTAKQHHMSFPPLLPVLCRLYSLSLPHDQFASLVSSVCACVHASMYVCVHNVVLWWAGAVGKHTAFSQDPSF